MNYGFLIRNDRCIGCHACSTACKSENQVPLGVHRTWVKNVETGEFPNTRRHFQVTRCNHCANPPCVRICPTTAMYQRDDGIVEFDPDRCIGCKACLQACPYDAIHVDPESGTAAKCHFCAHRVELDLEPACVVVCPEHAIISGDMDDPDSEISRELAKHHTTVRKPEQGTAPKLFYVDGEDVALHPTATDPEPATFAWADTLERSDVGRPGARPKSGSGTGGGAGGRSGAPDGAGRGARTGRSGAGPTGASADASGGSAGARGATAGPAPRGHAELRSPQPQGRPSSGPIQVGSGRMADGMVRTAYNVQHQVPWHWQVPAYLVTKGIAAGIFLLLAVGYLAELVPFDSDTFLAGGFLSLFFTGATTALLVADLERPERFLSVLTRPQWKSWLVRGAYILVAFSAVVGVWWALEGAARLAWLRPDPAEAVRPWAFATGSLLAVGVATYTAFLFGQAEGRDLWQSTLLPLHLILQALVAGAATFLILGTVMTLPPELGVLPAWTVALGLVADLGVVFLGEFGMPHASDTAAEAAEAITRGKYRRHFWWGGVGAGHVAPLALLGLGAASSGALGAGPAWIGALAGALTLVGLYLYEHAFVMAPQEVPNS